jgi:hypothetical protein
MGFFQKYLSNEQLREGLDVAIDDVYIPDEPLALLAKRSEGMAEGGVVKFQASFDSLDELKIALLYYEDRSVVALKEYKGAPVAGMQIMTDQEGSWSYRRLDQILESLGLGRENLIWSRPGELEEKD